jgi:hypothetical protein
VQEDALMAVGTLVEGSLSSINCIFDWQQHQTVHVFKLIPLFLFSCWHQFYEIHGFLSSLPWIELKEYLRISGMCMALLHCLTFPSNTYEPWIICKKVLKLQKLIFFFQMTFLAFSDQGSSWGGSGFFITD